MCLVSFVSGLLFHACFVFRPFCLPGWRSISVLLFAQYLLQFVTQFGFLVFYSRHCPGVFFAALCGFIYALVFAGFYVALFMHLLLFFVLFSRHLSGVSFFATFFVFAGFLYNLVLFVHFLAIRLSYWVFACLYVLAFRFRHRTRVCLHYHCVAFCVNR